MSIEKFCMIKRRKIRRRGGVSEDYFKFQFFPANFRDFLVLHCQRTDFQVSTTKAKRISKLRVYIFKTFLNWIRIVYCCCMKMNSMEAEAGLFHRHTICEILSHFYLRLPTASYTALLARENIRKNILIDKHSSCKQRRDATLRKKSCNS